MSYNDKHNEANSENNEDGENRNRSGNCGTEGDTDDSAVLARRARQQRNFLTTLLAAEGIPMLAHGDESGRSQRGNNNACCQHGPLSWVDRSLAEQDSGLWRMNEDDWARPPMPSAFTSTGMPSLNRTRWVKRSRTTPFCCCSTPVPQTWTSRSPRHNTRRHEDSPGDTAQPQGADETELKAQAATTLEPHRSVVLRRTS
ncbi:hypothetical protein ACFZA1_29325 [Streptomyces filipinensis]|uniref:hypothetical protein n=1 Tax=Streptomyces filipinensis TaxID=66887 RepID=UPI0036E5B531